MMDSATLNRLREHELITTGQHEILTCAYNPKPFSLFHELRAALAIGVLLFTTGAGMVVYRNIDTIGHEALIVALLMFSALCFWQVERQREKIRQVEVSTSGILNDTLALLGCLLFSIVVEYAQYEYSIFGTHWNLGALVPAVVSLAAAYRYDHRGALVLGITGLAAWAGLTVSPVEVLKQGMYSSNDLIYTGLFFGAALIAIALYLDHAGIKKHFTFSAVVYGANILLFACVAGEIQLDQPWPYFALLLVCCAAAIFYARRMQSFLFLLMACVYGYVGLTRILFQENFFHGAETIFLYFVVSCGVIIAFVFNGKRFLSKP